MTSPIVRRAAALALTLAALTGCTAGARVDAAVSILPSSPPDLAVTVKAGQAVLPGGEKAAFPETRLTFDPPEAREETIEVVAPGDWAESWESWEPWPKSWRDKTLAVHLKPGQDEEATPILGGLYHQIHPESVVVTSADGSKTFTLGQDYKLNAAWGQIGGIAGRLGKSGTDKLKVRRSLTLQRLDLVQVGPGGKVTVKKGKSRIVCPELPEPDAGHVALAGVYIAPWKARDNPHLAEAGAAGRTAAAAIRSDYAVTKHEILPIDPAAPVEPVNKAAVARTLKKLRDGQEARIAFMGASITLGAEAPAWWANLWTEKNLGYPSRVVVALRRQFPKATVTPIDSFKGGTTTKFGLERMDQDVVPKKPDLVLIAFGGNDVAGPVGRPPNNPPQEYKEDMRKLIRRAKEVGAEVMIVCVMQQHPWMEAARRWPAYRQVQLELSKEENVALADVYTEWMNQATRGVPPFTQLHNWINHPGKAGHKVFADVILRFFQ